LLRSHNNKTVFPAATGNALTTSGLDQLLYRLFDRVGRRHFDGLHLGAHTFRHTFATAFIQAGGSIYHLSRILGHSQVTTTEGYLTSVTARQVREGALSPLDALGALPTGQQTGSEQVYSLRRLKMRLLSTTPASSQPSLPN
jgi:integrase/recombinase XerD